MLKYKVRPGFTHGAQKQYKEGDIVELTAEEAAGFLDKLELVTGKGATKSAGLVVNPAPNDVPATKREAAEQVEEQLEAETGKEFQQTSSNPAVLAETDKSSGKRAQGAPARR